MSPFHISLAFLHQMADHHPGLSVTPKPLLQLEKTLNLVVFFVSTKVNQI